MYWIGIIVAALAIGASIALHELGHFLPARLFKVKVTQFMVGFGPTVFSRKRGETEYGFKALPLGGYIRMVGMVPRPPQQRGATMGDVAEDMTAEMTGGSEGAAGNVANDQDGTDERRESFWRRLITDTRASAWKDTDPGDDARAFYRLAPWKKIIVMAGGPAVNLLLCIGLLSVLYMGIGLPQPTNLIGSITACTPTAAAASTSTGQSPATGSCPQGSAVSPSVLAGLQAGDRIVAVDGTATGSWPEVTAQIRPNMDRTVTLTVDRDGQTLLVPVTLGRFSPDPAAAPVGFLGVGAGLENVTQPWSTVPIAIKDMIGMSVERLATLPVGVAQTATATVRGEERPADSPVSVVGVTRISGEIAALPEERPENKIASLLSLIAGVNLFLFLFNMLPLLPLDGGHIAGAVWESIRRHIARLRKAEDPGPVDVSVLAPVAYMFGLALIALSAVIILADLINPIRVFG